MVEAIETFDLKETYLEFPLPPHPEFLPLYCIECQSFMSPKYAYAWRHITYLLFPVLFEGVPPLLESLLESVPFWPQLELSWLDDCLLSPPQLEKSLLLPFVLFCPQPELLLFDDWLLSPQPDELLSFCFDGRLLSPQPDDILLLISVVFCPQPELSWLD